MDPSDPQGQYRGTGFASSNMLFELRGRRVCLEAHLHDRRKVVCTDLVQQLSATCDACILLATLRTSETFYIATRVSKFAEARIVSCCVRLLHNLDYLRPLLQPHGYTLSGLRDHRLEPQFFLCVSLMCFSHVFFLCVFLMFFSYVFLVGSRIPMCFSHVVFNFHVFSCVF